MVEAKNRAPSNSKKKAKKLAAPVVQIGNLASMELPPVEETKQAAQPQPSGGPAQDTFKVIHGYNAHQAQAVCTEME